MTCGIDYLIMFLDGLMVFHLVFSITAGTVEIFSATSVPMEELL